MSNIIIADNDSIKKRDTVAENLRQLEHDVAIANDGLDLLKLLKLAAVLSEFPLSNYSLYSPC